MSEKERNNKDYNEKLSYHLYNSINVIISLIKFQNNFQVRIKNNNNNPGQKLILIERTWFDMYKKFYLYDDMFNIIKQNNLSFENIDEKKYLFNNIFKSFVSKNRGQNMVLFYNTLKEFPKIINDKKNPNICFISEFALINKEIYDNLKKHMGDFNISSSLDDKEFEYIIYDSKIIIKYIKEQENCYNLIIGNFNHGVYIPESYISFETKQKLEEESLKIHDPSKKFLAQIFKDNNIKDITSDFLNENGCSLYKFYVFGYNDLNEVKYTNNIKHVENSTIDLKNIVKFFIQLKNEYKDIIKKRDVDLKNKQEYYLINKNWIDKFKQIFCYDKFEKIMNDNLPNIKEDIILSNIKPEINKIENKYYEKTIYDLSNISLFIVNYNYCEKAKIINHDYIKVYEDFELWTEKTYNCFKDIGFIINNEPKKIEFYFEKKHIFIHTKNNFAEYLNIYELNDNLNYVKRMVIKCKDMKFILEKITNKFFLSYIYYLNLSENEILKINKNEGDGLAYLLSKEGKIYDTIYKKIKRIDIIISIFIHINETRRKMKESIKENLEKNNNTKEKFYLVHKNLLELYLTQTGLNYIYDCLKKAKLEEKFKDDKPIEEKKNEFKKYIYENINFNLEKIIDIISKISTGLVNKKNQLDYIIVRNHSDKIHYINDYYLLDGEIVGKVNENLKNNLQKFECLIGDDLIFIFHDSNNIINVGKLDNNGLFKIKLIIDINNNVNEVEQKIIEEGKSYIRKHFVFTSNQNNEIKRISPYFGDNLRVKGYGYPIDKNVFNKIEDFSDFNINNFLIKMIYLKILFLNYKNNLENDTFIKDKYFLISEDWMNTFKETCNYEKTDKDIENNKILQSILKDKGDQRNLLLKKIYYIIEHILEINKSFNDKKIDFSQIKFPTEEPSLNGFLLTNEENITFYNNFYLIDKNTFEYIYDIKEEYLENMKSKNNYCECFLKDGYIFIKLNKESITGSNKIIFEVGNLDINTYKFNLQYILVYNNEEDYNKSIDFLKKYYKNGFKEYFSMINFNHKKIITLKINNKIFGSIYSYNPQINLNHNLQSYPQPIPQPIQQPNPQPIQQPNPQPIQQTNPQPIPQPNQLPKPQTIQAVPIVQKFDKAPRIGLQNVGATCYMNATLQCLCQIERLVDHFRLSSRILEIIEKYKNKKEDSLTDSFKYLIENLWPSDKKYYNKIYNHKNQNNEYFVPKEFKEKISKMNPLFAGAKANDSKDLVNFIIMRLHEELNEGIKYENNNVPSQEDEKSMFEFFKYSSEKENKSIISDLFYGINGTLYECIKCHTKKYNYQIGFFYIFPLEEVRKFKIQNLKQNYMNSIQYQMQQMAQFGFMNNMNINFMNNMNMNNMNNMNMNNMNLMLMCQPYFAQIQNINSVNIIDCFDFNQKIETMTGENSMYCNICKRQESAYYQSYIVTTPEIIIIILNRGKGIEFNVKLEFTELLNIQNYVKNNNSPHTFKLIGVVTHLGESGASGHFIAYCLSPIDNKWYNYNDDLCIPVTNFQEQVINYAMPYILFYKRV